MQRDVEFEVDSMDKSGGFIGSLYLNKTENAAVALVREGLASVQPYSADNLSWAKQLYDAEVSFHMYFMQPRADLGYWLRAKLKQPNGVYVI